MLSWLMALPAAGKTDKLKETPIALQDVEGSDIKIPMDSRVAFVVSLANTREALFAWDGYAKVAPAQKKMNHIHRAALPRDSKTA